MKHLAAQILPLCILHLVFGEWVPLAGAQGQPKPKPELMKPENIQGCYELSLSPWRPNLNLGEDEVFITPPPRIQLFAERGKEGWESEGYIVKPAPSAKPSIHRGSYWLPRSADSIEIVWTTGFSGLLMGLRIEGSDLRGQAKSFWDFTRKRQTADVFARKVECEAVPNSVEAIQSKCKEDTAQPKIVAGEGWGPVRIGAAYKAVDAFLGEGQSRRGYSKVFYKDYPLKGIQVAFENSGRIVHNIYFYNGQRDMQQFSVFCGQVDRGINWQSSIDDVKGVFGQPDEEFSGFYLGETWKRLVFDGIDFRFENEKMVRIGIPGD